MVFISAQISAARRILLKISKKDGGSVAEEKFVSPTLGKNFSGDQFFTDGNAYVITLH